MVTCAGYDGGGGGDLEPDPEDPPAGNHYRRVAGVGAWGGICTCPDGQTYNVGDMWDSCENGPGSLACEGGTPGECVQEVDAARDGMKVTCAGAAANGTAADDPAAAKCRPPAEWEHLDGAVICGECAALVQTAAYNRCDHYCESFGHVCVAAAEEDADTCRVIEERTCDQVFDGTSDMLCTCELQR